MTPETPLPEVAHHLPAQAAEHLLAYDPIVQEATLKQVRDMVVFWETQRYIFDPVAYEGILMAVVATVASLYHEGALLSSRAFAAETLNEILAEQLTAHVCKEQQP